MTRAALSEVRRRFTRHDDEERAAEEAVRPFPLSSYALSRLEAPDAPRFKADPSRVFDRK